MAFPPRGGRGGGDRGRGGFSRGGRGGDRGGRGGSRGQNSQGRKYRNLYTNTLQAASQTEDEVVGEAATEEVVAPQEVGAAIEADAEDEEGEVEAPEQKVDRKS